MSIASEYIPPPTGNALDGIPEYLLPAPGIDPHHKGNGSDYPDLPTPQSLENEFGAIAGVHDGALQNPPCSQKRLALLFDAYFKDPRAIVLLHALRQLDLDSRPLDATSLLDYLTAHEKLDAAGGIIFVGTLDTFYTSFDGHLDIIRDRSIRRHFAKLIPLAQEAVNDYSADPRTVLSQFTEVLNAVVTSDPRKSSTDLTIKNLSEMMNTKMDPYDCILGDYLLAKGQAMSIIGPGGSGKSRFNFQLAVNTILSRPYVGLDTHGKNLKWLIFQVENGDRRMLTEASAISRTLSDAELAIVDEHLFVHTLSSETDSMVSLDDPANHERIARAIAKYQPDIIAFDPLNRFCVGDPNSDQDMARTCAILSHLCFSGNHNRSIVVIHHALTGKGGAVKSFGADRSSYGRNSKTLFAWVRGQLNIAPVSENDNDTLSVVCGKCSNGREFPHFAIRLNPDTLIYDLAPDVDLDKWKEDLTGRKAAPSMPPARVAQLCPTTGATKAALAKLIEDDCGCVRSTAWTHVDKADRAKTIRWNHKTESFFPS